MPFNILISAQQLNEIKNQENLVIIDARHKLDDPNWGQNIYIDGHITGAGFMHMDRDLSGEKTGKNGRHPLPDVDQLIDKLQRLGVSQDSQVVVYDQDNAMMAARLWWLLKWIGHDQVAVLDGGFKNWLAQGFEQSEALVEPVRGDIKANVNNDMIVETQKVLENIGRDHYLVLDARSPERFMGKAEPIDPVAGHIPGAVNRFCAENIDSSGLFKAPKALKAEFTAVIGQAPATQIVNQCGSGLTACHNMLAMEVAGLSGAKIYPGSWSEWCCNIERPIERSK